MQVERNRILVTEPGENRGGNEKSRFLEVVGNRVERPCGWQASLTGDNSLHCIRSVVARVV